MRAALPQTMGQQQSLILYKSGSTKSSSALRLLSPKPHLLLLTLQLRITRKVGLWSRAAFQQSLLWLLGSELIPGQTQEDEIGAVSTGAGDHLVLSVCS